jgi:cysteine-rich repeat protein
MRARGVYWPDQGRVPTVAQDIYFTVNGAEVARAPLKETCDCLPGIVTVQVTDPAVVGQVHVGDVLTILLHTFGEVAWATAEIHGSGWGERAVVFDAHEGQDAENENPDLCQAQWFAGPDGVGVAGTMTYGEECDDGNTIDTDGCTNSCTLPVPVSAVAARKTASPRQPVVVNLSQTPVNRVMTKRILP